eukprot:scaffold9857_cov127-Cylindrotheca_fusiformis.AAC.9
MIAWTKIKERTTSPHRKSLMLGRLICVVNMIAGLVSASGASSHSPRTLILLDVDNTLYRESAAGIEAQIVSNTHSFCLEHYGMDKSKADELFKKYGSTVEGLKRTLWHNSADRVVEKEVADFYRGVYKDIDYSSLLLRPKPVAESSTGYSHVKERELLSSLLQSSPHDLCVASNSPSWHVQKTLEAMGLGAINFQHRFTPDRFPLYPTKNDPQEYFAGACDDLNAYDRLICYDDSTHNLNRICDFFSNAKGVHVSDEMPLAESILRNELVDQTFSFNQVRYLESKNIVDRSSIDSEMWNSVVEQLLQFRNRTLRIVDVGAGILSMLDLFLHGDPEAGLDSLLDGVDVGVKFDYTAYESNRDLLGRCHERLVSWGLSLKERKSSNEFVYERKNVRVRLILDNFDAIGTSHPPDLIVGCCFADLMDPSQLATSLIRSFHLLESKNTMVYFPITFGGTTQFLPPRPFATKGHSSIPSDTVAFRLYSKALVEKLGHSLDPRLLCEAMEDHGVYLERKGTSNWKIDHEANPYLYETMLYFFGTTGAPQILQEGWDAYGWMQRAREHRPIIRVSNFDLLFRIGQRPSNTGDSNEDAAGLLEEIQFTAPGEVTTTTKDIPELGPYDVLILMLSNRVHTTVKASHSLISSGTELKIYNGLFDDAALDVTIEGMKDERMAYPLAYGYCLVGRIIKCGSSIATDHIGKLVFSFSPHATHVVSNINNVQLVPDGISAEDAIFMPSVETALSLVQDAHPRVGENVAVYGQGLIGLLVTSVLCLHNEMSVLKQFGTVTVFDQIPDRLGAAAGLGASQALFPCGSVGPFDVAIEVSGNGKALQSAIDHTSNGGRVIVGSWYGSGDVNLKLGIDFHRSHKSIRTSQVSDIPPELLGTWNKERRFRLTWELIKQIRPSKLLTKTTTLDKASLAYESLQKGQEIAVAFTFP